MAAISHIVQVESLSCYLRTVPQYAYEYMIGQFAAGAGKKAGEFYTPQEVSQILAEIVITGKQRLKTVYDPTCGSGSLLLRTARSGQADEIFGQEKNPTTFNLCRMNMLL